MSMKYIRDTYKVPAKRGARIKYRGVAMIQTGTIVGSKGAYIRVRIDGDPFRRVMSYHPTYQMTYL